jgi:hypothetical protein
MQAPIAASRRQEVEAVIDEVLERMGPDVVYIRYNFGEDWTGGPAVFFRVVLSDEASRRENLHRVAQRVSTMIETRMDTLEPDVFAFFNFRSVSEQQAMKTPAWV